MSMGWKGQGQSGFKGQGSAGKGKGDGAWGKVIPNPKLKLMDQVREVVRDGVLGEKRDNVQLPTFNFEHLALDIKH
jgi:hypothetical protein